jgi:hypothetical protein
MDIIDMILALVMIPIVLIVYRMFFIILNIIYSMFK